MMGRPLKPDRKNPHRRAAEQAWYQANKERLRARQRAYYWATVEAHRDRRLKLRYGITASEFDQLYAHQDGCCAICGRQETRLVVDHCHTTGLLRGLLCDNHNKALGMFGDDPEGLNRAVTYLTEPPAVGLGLERFVKVKP